KSSAARRVESRDGSHGVFGFSAVGYRGVVAEPVIIVVADHLEYQAVATWDEKNVLIGQSIVDVRLRNRARQLPPYRSDGLVAKQCASTETRGINQRLLPKRCKIGWCVELHDLDPSAIGQEVRHQQARIGGQIEHHHRILLYESSTEG